MKVTQVEPQKKNPRRFNVFLDGKFAIGADEDLIVNFRLLPGKEINLEDLEKLLYEAEVGKLMERMYGLFSIRQRSEKEIRDYLKRLSFKRKIKDESEISEVVINQLIERAKQKTLINDIEFARSWVDGRRRSKNLGERALKMELAQKGIAREIVEEVFSSQSSDIRQEQEEKLATEALEKRINRWKNLPELEFKKKATDYLLRKGFEYSFVKNVVEKSIKKGYN